MNEPARFLLRTVSPIHIGCDEVYEPTSFIVDEGNGRLVSLDPIDFIRSLDSGSKEMFSSICKKGTIASILEIYKFMRGRHYPGFEVEVCPGFLEHYKKTLGILATDEIKIQQELNNFIIARTVFNPNNNQPCIPGSAVKGALRTAYLNIQAELKPIPPSRDKWTAKQLEKHLLDGGSFDTDPFRMLKISDFQPVGMIKRKIVYAVNVKKKPSKFEARGPSQILEVIEPGSLFEGVIVIDKPQEGAGIRTPLSQGLLFKSAEKFYLKSLEGENRDLTSIGTEPVQLPSREAAFVLRVGRHCGAESVTIEGHREIRIMQGREQKAKLEKQATTFWLAANVNKPVARAKLMPFGWAVIEQISEEAIAQIKEEMERNKAAKETSSRLPSPIPQGYQDLGTRVPEKLPISFKKEIWRKAILTWRPNDQQITATYGTKKAFGWGKHLIPEAFHGRLFGKKKHPVIALVEVEAYGNTFKIIRVEATD